MEKNSSTKIISYLVQQLNKAEENNNKLQKNVEQNQKIIGLMASQIKKLQEEKK